jgi:hypothetical protein
MIGLLTAMLSLSHSSVPAISSISKRRPQLLALSLWNYDLPSLLLFFASGWLETDHSQLNSMTLSAIC